MNRESHAAAIALAIITSSPNAIRLYRALVVPPTSISKGTLTVTFRSQPGTGATVVNAAMPSSVIDSKTVPCGWAMAADRLALAGWPTKRSASLDRASRMSASPMTALTQSSESLCSTRTRLSLLTGMIRRKQYAISSPAKTGTPKATTSKSRTGDLKGREIDGLPV